MKKFILFFALIMTLVISNLSFAQSVTFKMKRPPLNQLKAADLWSATITNSGETFSAYLFGSMTNNENGELIATGQTMTFEVKRGTTNFKVSDLPRVPDVNYLSKDSKYKQSFMNTGGAPPGEYKICVELRYVNNTVAGEDCFDQKITGGDAPQLISPKDEEELSIANPVFTWMHMKGPGSNQTYTLRIVELIGEESPENAMVKNKAFFEKEGIQQTLFQYPSSSEKFTAGKTYAWQISIGGVKSNINLFKIIVTDPGGCTALDTTRYKVDCMGLDHAGNHVYQISNLILRNISTNSGSTGQSSTGPSPYIIPIAPLTIASLVPASSTIPASSNIPISFEAHTTSTTSLSFWVDSYVTIPTSQGPTYCNKHILVEVNNLPHCPESGCDSAIACFTMKDTVCLSDCFSLDASCSQNETDYFLSVQESDINWNRYGTEQMEWFSGTASNSIDVKQWYSTKAEWQCDKYYRIKIAVKNSCTPWSEYTKLIYVKCCDRNNCADFENGTTQGWTGNNAAVTQISDSGNTYIQTTDLGGPSFAFSTIYNGKWMDSLCTTTCTALCFDVQYLYAGNGNTTLLTIVPNIVITNGTLKAAFSTNASIGVDGNWHSYCAPIGPRNSDGSLPSNADGHWVMQSGTNAQWNALLNNVTQVNLPVDPTSYQGERIGYDNICLKSFDAIACFSARDTVCLKDPIIIDGSCSQNETDYFLSVQESDVNWNGYGTEQMQWISGAAPNAIDIKAWYTSKGGVWQCDKYYRVKLAVKNSCTPWSSVTKLMFVKCCAGDTCTNFEDGTTQGWTGNNAGVVFKLTGGNPSKYIETVDQVDASYVFSHAFNGNWIDRIGSDNCGTLHYDVNYIFDGEDNNGSQPNLHTSFTIYGPSSHASFVSGIIAVGSGWHSYSAPIRYLNPGDPFPSNSDGNWTMPIGSTYNDWNNLITNITEVRVPVDPTSYQAERIGYDNICLTDKGDCRATTSQCDSTLNHVFNQSDPFANSLTTSQLIDFTTNQDGSLISPSGSTQALNGWVRYGLTFSNTTAYWNQYIVSGANQFMTILFPAGMYRKAGFGISTYLGGPGSYIIKITSGNCIYTYTRYNLSYFGINLPTNIDKIEITCTNGTFLVDNLKFGN